MYTLYFNTLETMPSKTSLNSYRLRFYKRKRRSFILFHDALILSKVRLVGYQKGSKRGARTGLGRGARPETNTENGSHSRDQNWNYGSHTKSRLEDC